MYVCIHVCKYVCMYVCIYICISYIDICIISIKHVNVSAQDTYPFLVLQIRCVNIT